ncbi:MAG: glycoside hydrolase family 32 protein [Planctomycetota bacterium]|nr:glycoside hydrolase family 32 protein [Planctomycetota bacterium]
MTQSADSTSTPVDPLAAVNGSRALRERMLRDPHRPRYHFAVPEGIAMPFDPNGAIFWRGRYHLFYILQDERGHCWGHASSADLVHWTHHPTALAPNPGDVDRGIFSGNAFVNLKGEATIMYHGVNAGNCVATSAEPELIHWTKPATNPIVRSPQKGEPEFGKYESWDPHGWVEGGKYFAIFGGRPATLFESDDMVNWRFRHNLLPEALAPAATADAGEDVSCPDFFPLGGRQMLLCISHKRGCRYYLGKYEGNVFTPESHHRMNGFGGTCFAPESLLDEKGRRIMWAWVLDRRPMAMQKESGSSGEMTLPRVLSLGPDGELRVEPVPELNVLRRNPRRVTGLALPAGEERTLKEIAGDSLELDIEIDPGQARQVGLKLRCSPDGAEETTVVVDRDANVVRVEFGRSSLDKAVVHLKYCMIFDGSENPPAEAQELPFTLAAGEPIRLRVFVDRSIVEVFVNGRQCITQRIYPTRADSAGVRLFARGGEAKVRSLWGWDMAPAGGW